MPYITFRNKKLYFRDEGKGKPVVLLHGFAEDGNIWNKQIDCLKKNYRLIIPDIPGSGRSEILEGNITLDDYAEAIKTIVDEILFEEKNTGKHFSMIGHSMGGYITLAFAEKYPEFLHSFGLFHSSAYADDENKKATRRKGIDFIKKNGSEAFLKTSIPNLFSQGSQKKHPEFILELFNISKKIAPDALIQYYEAMILRPERTLVLQSFSKPILFIAGKHDMAVPLQISLRQSSLSAILDLHILKHSAHMGMWEEEKVSNKYLKGFLDIINY